MFDQIGQITQWSYKKFFSVVLFLCLFVCANASVSILSFYFFFTCMNPYLLPLESEKAKSSILFYAISSVNKSCTVPL